MAGVINVGTDRNWTGHEFGQANWYALGRLAWDHQLSSEEIADERIKMTFTHDDETISKIKSIMLNSLEAAVNYMTPLGLHHIMVWENKMNSGNTLWEELCYKYYESLKFPYAPGIRPTWETYNFVNTFLI